MKAIFAALSPAAASARLTVLIFHRVTAQPDPLFPSEVDARRFDQLLGWLKRWFAVLPLDQAAQRLRAGTLPARAAAITFDDGYADNATVALPLLQRHGLASTFFIATGFIDGGRMWNDTVIEAIRRSAVPRLDLDGLGPAATLSLGQLAIGSAAQQRAAVDAVIGRIKYLPADERALVVAQIAERSRAALPDDLMMSSAQLKALRAGGMQLGAHTVTHPILASLDDAGAEREIAGSRRWLEQLLGEPISLFAYPNGKPGADYGERDAAIVRRLGFDAAVSTAPGAAGAGTDPFQLPRFTPWDRGRWRFGLRLARNLWPG